MNTIVTMIRACRIFPALFLAIGGAGFVAPPAFGQFAPGLQSLDTPTDPRSVAMGESFVAVHSLSSLMYNPAGLAGGRGASFSISRRNFDHLTSTESFRYITYQGAVETPFANFGLFYSRFIQGELPVTTPAFPEGNGTVSSADYVLGLTAARNIVGGLDAGLTLKTFRFVEEAESGTPPVHNSNTPALVDLGVIYSCTGELVNGSGRFMVSGGASLQNFGTDFKPLASASNGASSSEYILKVPRYLRCGVALSVDASPVTTGGFVPFSLLVTTEYRNFLNGYDKDNRAFWGFGGEVSLYEIVTGRIGGFIQPVSGIYGVRGTPALRLGLGLSLPMERFGIDAPLIVGIDYGAIPLNTQMSVLPIANSTLHMVSLGVRYVDPLFERSSEP